MRSVLQALMSVLLTTAFFAYSAEALSQDQRPTKDQAPGNAREVPGNLRLRFGIGGRLLGGANNQIQMSVVNGVRTVTAIDGDEKVEISDTNGKKITLKHTRVVGGKSETTEYKAADLAALKLQSPVAAALYEKYTADPGVQVIAGGRLQFAAPKNGRHPDRVPFAVNDNLEPVNHGPRKIRVDLEDRKIEIHDGHNSSIRMKITKVVDGKEQINEFTADNIHQFKVLHPDLCPLYEKYTGIKVN